MLFKMQKDMRQVPIVKTGAVPLPGHGPGDVVRFGEQVPADLPRKNGIPLINRNTVHNGVGCAAFVGLLQ